MTSETISDQKDSEEVKTVYMAFADQHELDPSMEEDDYLEEPVMAVQGMTG